MKRCLSAVSEELCLVKKMRFQDVVVSAGSCTRPIQELGTNLRNLNFRQSHLIVFVGSG